MMRSWGNSAAVQLTSAFPLPRLAICLITLPREPNLASPLTLNAVHILNLISSALTLPALPACLC
jgi:hypothetical protein